MLGCSLASLHTIVGRILSSSPIFNLYLVFHRFYMHFLNINLIFVGHIFLFVVDAYYLKCINMVCSAVFWKNVNLTLGTIYYTELQNSFPTTQIDASVYTLYFRLIS